ncbi:NDP-sugar epimerase, includes UDP-GlcNAc-inverting 4,6-dehydratase FlaA1 and capsular polysaccharide biosynthesis protein EpsC [Pseudooceanicola antarcticus]|uniref:Polysaccharide biosynthesis protein n=1 Tax=Pseudooceanicola antarcticus TaxID=1247613 RepID=A0A285HUR2_9RHOB|nr:nucleoside-diphosphate sugar epimerase/dehydratase [Pseudooceanicola antarcticus]PJE27483.1 polysaccharide biosynthesis protein [Pseudooceanicola antarcticus]SNY39419.1 NDP-sugar epimerase, includes UDP-GlcNAc-inverting 4,6-dehydratase FlaA1 and capsular polysaccharide biosynthesis protein EpsC [Pseudooceanicola antarcticus]
MQGSNLRTLARWLTGLAPGHKALTLLALDGLAVAGAVVILDLVLPGGLPGPVALWAGLLFIGLGAVLSLHRMKLRDYQRQGLPRSLAQGLGLLVGLLPMLGGQPRMAQLLLLVGLSVALSLSGRIALLRLALIAHALARRPQQLLIWGAGRAGQQLAAALAGDEAQRVVGFLDDDARKQGRRLVGLPVHAPSRAGSLVARQQVDRVILALPRHAHGRARQALAGAGCEVMTLPGFAARLWGAERAPPDVTRLLGRAGLDRVLPEVRESYAGQVVLVTGAGGSIGAELSRQLARLGPARLILLDHSELALYDIARELEGIAPEVSAVLGSVCDAALVTELLQGRRVEVIFHAAAYKHVPLVEDNPLSGLENNVIGTRVLAEAAARSGVGRMILISTDKAVRPTSLMGASKRLAEEVVQDLAGRSTTTRFAMVRFGNVMGSSGSVVPLFAEQIARGGPVTVTHPEVTRYFMTAEEAVRLTLLAGAYACGGEVFVLDMGAPQKILHLARQMILGAGLTPRDADHPDGEIEIRFTGLRPGEKLEEELLIGDDMLPTPHPRILRAQEAHLSQIKVAAALSDLKRALENRDAAAARAAALHWAGGAVQQSGTGWQVPGGLPPPYAVSPRRLMQGQAGPRH